MSSPDADADADADDYDDDDEESIRTDEALDLLDKYWFFGNLRNHKASPKTMLRCFSEPRDRGGCSFDSDLSLLPGEELSKDVEPVTGGEEGEEGKSLLDCYAEIMKGKGGGGSDTGGIDGAESLPRKGLVRAPSLPPDIGRTDTFREEEGGVLTPRMNVPRRQVSLSLSDTRLRPPRNPSKGMLQSSSALRYRSDWYPSSIKSKKSMSDLEREEVQGFRDLGFSFDDKDMNQNLISILPGLQERSSQNEEHNSMDVQRPYLSEAWIAQSYAPPPIPKWNANGSPEDMKAHIKHWARSVASNVR